MKILFLLCALIFCWCLFSVLHLRVFVVASDSMFPAIKRGDVVFVQKRSDYALREIISFQSLRSSEVITHRVVGIINAGVFTTKGDANSLADRNEVMQGSVIGQVIFTIPLLGYPVLWLQWLW